MSGYSRIGASAGGGGGGSGTYPPLDLTKVYEYEEFIGGNIISGSVGKLGWGFDDDGALVSLTYRNNSGYHQGTIKLEASDNDASRGLLYLPSGEGSSCAAIHPKAGTGAVFASRFIFVLADVGAPAVAARVGFYLNRGTGIPTAGDIGFYLEKLASDTNWFVVSNNDTAPTTRTDTGVPALTAGWSLLTINWSAVIGSNKLRFKLESEFGGSSSDIDMNFNQAAELAEDGYGPFFEIQTENDDLSQEVILIADFWDVYITGIPTNRFVVGS